MLSSNAIVSHTTFHVILRIGVSRHHYVYPIIASLSQMFVHLPTINNILVIAFWKH